MHAHRSFPLHTDRRQLSFSLQRKPRTANVPGPSICSSFLRIKETAARVSTCRLISSESSMIDSFGIAVGHRNGRRGEQGDCSGPLKVSADVDEIGFVDMVGSQCFTGSIGPENASGSPDLDHPKMDDPHPRVGVPRSLPVDRFPQRGKRALDHRRRIRHS